ncbi:glycosyltransferase [Kocuria palustris]|uniref:glycosyltransferase n=1 Tax=Kocuria palustris TaxID=71999 RepID=UPI0011A28C04|nr:glycosyltransferase [Kocuria palustris]
MERSSAVDVLHVVEAFGGGVAAAVRDYVRDLPEATHHIVCRLRPEAGTLGAAWQDDFASVTAVEGGHANAVRTVRALIRDLSPDVVHSHSSYAGVWARLASVGLEGFRSVYTPHAWAFARQDKSSLERFGYRVVERALLERTDVLAGCSRAELAPARRWNPKVQLVHVPNIAEDLDTSSVPELVACSAHPGGPLVVGSGRLAQQKDPAWFRDAVLGVRAGGHAVRALWVGGGDDAMQADLEAAGIEVTGWVSPGEVERRLAAADLYLHTAAWEGFPITVLEAARLRRPIAVRSIQAFHEVSLPIVLDAPSDLAAQWERIRQLSTREEMLRQQDRALQENCAGIQHDRLAQAYGLDVQPWGIGGRPVERPTAIAAQRVPTDAAAAPQPGPVGSAAGRAARWGR